jgi:hypothetical protein
MKRYALLLFLLTSACSGSGGVGAVSCGSSTPTAYAPAPSTSTHVSLGQLPAIDLDALLAHTKTLSSDEYEGRAPGTKGEELAVTYLADQFKKAGLKPGNTDGTYFQNVPLVGITPTPWWHGRSTWRHPRASTTPSWCSSATASKPPSSTGTTTRAPI